MFNSIKFWLLKPYPFVTTTKQKLLMSLVFGKIVFLLLYFFKPFNISKLDNNLVQYTFGFGLITFLITLINLLVFPYIFPKFFNPNKWVIWKMSLFFLATIALIGVVNWYYNLLVARPIDQLDHSFLHYIAVTLLVGFLPLLFYIYIRERKNNKQYNLVATKLSDIRIAKHETIDNETKLNTTITLVTANQKDSLSLVINDLIYISSEANYARILYIYNGDKKEQLLKISLSELEKQLQNFEFILRCHNSYIVNTHHVNRINANARGYFLQLNTYDFAIPVSRSFPKEFLFMLVK